MITEVPLDDRLSERSGQALLGSGTAPLEVASPVTRACQLTIDDWRGELQAETTQRQRALAALAHSLGLYTDQPKEPVAAITIRAVGSIAELTEVFDLLGAQFDPPIDHTDERRFGRLRSVFPQQRDLLLVAEAGQELIGGALGFLDDDAHVTLRILALAANHRRRGVGRSLLQAFENNAMALGATRVSLGADQEVGFYIRHGYQTMLLLQWVFNPDDHESEAKAVLTGPLSQAVHAHREFEGTKQLFIDLDDPNPALYMYVGDKAPGATASYVMKRCLPHAPGTRNSSSRTDR
jgi:GNAT superfamily N-acetyltransferase